MGSFASSSDSDNDSNQCYSSWNSTSANSDDGAAKKKRKALGDAAKSHRWETLWALNVRKAPDYPKINDSVFQIGDPKCNLFVCDMIYEAGITPPLTSCGKWPITASMWTGAVSGWKKVFEQEKGDVVSDGRHCGIAVDGTYTMSAGIHLGKVYMDTDLSGGTIQRYDP